MPSSAASNPSAQAHRPPVGGMPRESAGSSLPPWMYRSEAFAEDFDSSTISGEHRSPLFVAPGAQAARRQARRAVTLWPWAVGVPVLVVSIGLLVAVVGG
jgi:hypothetical protein